MSRTTLMIAILALAACGGESADAPAAAPEAPAPQSETPILIEIDETGPGAYTLAAEESIVIGFPSEASMLVTFGFEVGSPSWDATNECPEVDVGQESDPFLMQICGGLTDANAEATGDEFASSYRGMHGGGVSFAPQDGMIRVRLQNYALEEMVFQIEAEADE